MIHELLKRVILVQWYPSFIYNDIACLSTAYLPKIFAFVSEAVVISQMFLRLITTFKKSGGKLGISQTQEIAYSLFLTSTCILWIVLFLISLEKPCYTEWESFININGNDGTLYLCKVPFGKKSTIVSLFAILWVSMNNVGLGLFFSYKLHRLMIRYGTDTNDDDSLQKVMVKNTILTGCIALSTLLLWNLVFAGLGLAIIYINSFTNVFCIGLMFKVNDKLYMKLFWYPHTWLINRYGKSKKHQPKELRQTSKSSKTDPNIEMTETQAGTHGL